MRCASAERGVRRLASFSAASAAACHAVSSASCTPSRRSSAPSSVSLSPRAAMTTRSFSAPVHFVCLFEEVISSTLRDWRSHRERTTCGTPTSFARAVALIADGPINRRSMRALNAGLYCAMSASPCTPRDDVRLTAPLLRSCDIYPDTGGQCQVKRRHGNGGGYSCEPSANSAKSNDGTATAEATAVSRQPTAVSVKIDVA